MPPPWGDIIEGVINAQTPIAVASRCVEQRDRIILLKVKSLRAAHFRIGGPFLKLYRAVQVVKKRRLVGNPLDPISRFIAKYFGICVVRTTRYSGLKGTLEDHIITIYN